MDRQTTAAHSSSCGHCGARRRLCRAQVLLIGASTTTQTLAPSGGLTGWLAGLQQTTRRLACRVSLFTFVDDSRVRV